MDTEALPRLQNKSRKKSDVAEVALTGTTQALQLHRTPAQS